MRVAWRKRCLSSTTLPHIRQHLFCIQRVAGVAHPSGRTCISNLCGETVDLRTYGKSTSSNAAGKQSINNRLNGNILELAYGNDSESILRSLLESRLVLPLQQQMKLWQKSLIVCGRGRVNLSFLLPHLQAQLQRRVSFTNALSMETR